MRSKILPPAEYLRQRFDYDPETGLLTWRARGVPNVDARLVGKVAGRFHARGYISVRLDGEAFYAHRIIWKMVTGFDPPDQIDHENHIKSDNRLSNLQPASYETNGRNHPLYAHNTSGVAGVSYDKFRDAWRVDVGVNGPNKFRGRFETFEQAVAVKRAAEAELGYHKNHGKFKLSVLAEIADLL